MKLLADLLISPRTVAFLRSLGHEAVRVDAILPKTASDEEVRGSAVTVEEGAIRSRPLPIDCSADH